MAGPQESSDRLRGPAEAINTGTPSTPRPAASIILLRRGGLHGDRELEVLLLQRSPDAAFMPSVWVFPGGTVDAEDGEGEEGFRTCAVRELEEESGIRLPAGEELILFSRWITPEFVKSRFDAWFYLALAPAHTPPKADGVETVDATWVAPQAALEAHTAGETALVFPTIRQLESLVQFATSEAAIAAARGKTVEPILPKVVGTKENHRVLLPGDPGYPD